MENTERDQPSIEGDTFPSSDVESEESTDTELTTSIDTAQPEAGKFSLTKPANEKVVQTELNGQTSNEASQTEQGTDIPVKENSSLTKGEDIKLSIQDYLDPGRTYSNRSAIKIPGDDTKKSKFNANYYRMMDEEIEKATSPKDNSDLIEIKNSLKSLHSFLQNKHRSDTAQIDDNALSDTDDYLDEGTNCSDPYSVLHVYSFTQAYDTAVKSRTGRERFNIRQAFTGNRKTKSEFNGKINMVYGELMEKADSLGELIRKLEAQIDENALSDTDDYSDEETNCSDPSSVFHVESFTQAYDTALKSRTGRERFNIRQALTTNRQVAEIATATKRDAGCLPGRTDLNPRRQVSAVILRSGKNLAASTRNNSDIGKPDDADETEKSNSHPIFLDELDPNPSQDNRKTTTEKAKEKAIDLELEEDTEIEDEIDRQYGTYVDRPKTPTVDQQPEKPIDRRSTQPEPIIERIDENTLSDTDDYSDEETNRSDPSSVFHVESFTQAYDTALKSRIGRERFNITQALTGNRKTKSEFYRKINMVYGELIEKADSLGELIRKLEGQVAEIAIAIKTDAGCLPGRTDLNPTRQVSAVILCSGKDLAAGMRNNSDIGKPDDADETGKSDTHPIFLDELDPNPSQDDRKTTAEKAKEKAIDLELEEDTEIEDEIDRQYGTDVDRPKTPTVDQQPKKPIDRRSTQPEPIIERVYRTLPPFPPKTQTKKSLENAICKKALDRISFEIFTQAYDTAVKSRTGRERFNIRQALTGNRQVAEIATAIKRDAGCLPGRTDLNPRRQVSAVMLHSGKNLAADTRNNSDVGESDDADKTGKSNSHPILINDLDPNPSQENRKTSAEKAKEKAIDLELEEDTEIEDKIDRQYGTDVDRPKKPTIDRQPEKPVDRRQAFTGNRKTKSEFYGKINMVYGELMEKADSLGELIQKLEGQVAEIATAIKRDAVCLPGRTDLNPRRQVSAVILCSGKNLAADTRNNTVVGKPDDTDKTGKSNSHPIILNDLDPNPSQENRKTTAEKAKEKAIDLELEEDTEIEDEIDRQYGTDVDQPKTPTIDR
ncbi:hypothetical protein F2Q68_00033430 [Brassica cretica]|uniref:Uncharacterized protein n=1 Tax=Brassica cretica TaxID=69181 RepID=A0A8S9H115_BRACR|nr:hypothetical protein F2Q68_00033430 [Brassica cretica]